jgi:sulfoxide reductase heme-binding subunit YedZ
MVLLERLKRDWLRIMVHVGALLPLAWTVWQYSQGLFLVDPILEITTRTGKTALILLMLSLTCTPLSILFGFRQVLRLRRPLGLYAFFYASLHFATFVWLDYGFDFGLLRQAIFDQRYVLAGLASGLILLVLAITATRGWQKRLGKNWKRLHRLAYLAAILAIVHFAWLSKEFREPLRYGLVLAVLLVLRLPRVRKTVSSLRQQLRSRLLPTRHASH